MVRNELRELAREHLPTVLAIGLFIVYGLKLLAVTRGSVTTAAAILGEVNVFNTLFGITLIVSPYILTILAMSLVFYLDINLTPLRLTIIFLPSLLFAPFSLIAPIYVGLIILLFVAMVVTRKPTVKLAEEGLVYIPAGFGIFLVVVVLISARMWLPVEYVDTGTESYSGYVLSADDEELVILRDSDRKVLRIPSPDVVERQYCELQRGWWSRSWDRPFVAVIGLRRSPAEYPACEDLST